MLYQILNESLAKPRQIYFLDLMALHPSCGPGSGVVLARADSWTLENVQERLQKMEEAIIMLMMGERCHVKNSIVDRVNQSPKNEKSLDFC